MPEKIETKSCLDCKEIKPIAEYSPVSNPRSRSGVLGVCKACMKLRNHRYGIKRFQPGPDLPGEEWRPVMGAEKVYLVSNRGRVRRKYRKNGLTPGRILKQSTDKDGYKHAGLIVDGKYYRRQVHILVAAAFIGICPEGKEINHIDTSKSNNEMTNLEYVTHLENIRHSIATGLQNNSPSGINRLKTHCNRGHVLSGENLYSYTTKAGGQARRCRTYVKIRKEQKPTHAT